MQPNITIKAIEEVNANDVRDFCLRIIKEVYGFEYRTDWHADLDSLLNKGSEYSKKQKGAFFVAINNNSIIGTIGIKQLATKPQLLKSFPEYKDGKDIGSIWRTYIDKKYRGKGIGKKLVKLAEDFALKNGFKIIYLHTSKQNSDALTFWQKRNYTIIREDNDTEKTVHLEKSLSLK